MACWSHYLLQSPEKVHGHPIEWTGSTTRPTKQATVLGSKVGTWGEETGNSKARLHSSIQPISMRLLLGQESRSEREEPWLSHSFDVCLGS